MREGQLPETAWPFRSHHGVGPAGGGVAIRLWLPGRRWLRLRGHVLYVTGRAELGIGFDGLTESEAAEFGRLLDHLERNLPGSAKLSGGGNE